MSWAEMVFDAGIDLFFFGFGVVTGAFVFWMERR